VCANVTVRLVCADATAADRVGTQVACTSSALRIIQKSCDTPHVACVLATRWRNVRAASAAPCPFSRTLSVATCFVLRPPVDAPVRPAVWFG
jgi:hypothetical protein